MPLDRDKKKLGQLQMAGTANCRIGAAYGVFA